MAAMDGAALALGLSTRRRTATLLTFVNATSMIDITSSAAVKQAPTTNSVPLSIGTCAGDDVQWSSSLRRRSHGHIPSDAAIRAESDAVHSFRNHAFGIYVL